MSELRIIIKPYKEDLIIPIEDKFSTKIINNIKKIKTKQQSFTIDIPEIGYRGMVLTYGKYTHVYVNKEKIFLTENSVTEIIIDRKQRINKMLLKKALPKYGKELNYFFEVMESMENKKETKSSQKEVIDLKNKSFRKIYDNTDILKLIFTIFFK